MVGLPGARHSPHPRLPAPSRPASVARALTDRRAGSSRVCVRTRRTLTTAFVIPARFECTMAIPRGQQVAHRQGGTSQRRSRCRDGGSDKRREQPRTSPFPCLALSGAQRPSPAVGNAHHESPAKEVNFGPDPLMADGSDERSKYSQRHDSAAALRLSGNDGRRARRVRTRHL